ncbi:PD-(D/E)XK nuclease-like domain-containing protein [Campylobacter jejuni]|uniref:PD-(D/E)XK nuclease-like domain-containing protein n=1 Tax=Campylobacter jejuni TaxID=197 RepID=UPI00073DF055|nr:PD-(D/E)XK nuclease-like domain-containing protein [Campylobacter jejuni]ALW15589.1 hypothetical protein RC26_02535 [Campylobacter jejuni]
MKIELNLSQSEYREKKEFLSASDIKLLLENPYKFKVGYKKPKSDNLALGSLIHTLILEPKKFEKEYLIMHDFNLRTNEGKKRKAELEAIALNEKKTLIKNEVYIQALEVVENFNKTSISNLFKQKGLAEASFFGKIDDIACKCRPDFIISEKEIILDLKTTSVENGASADIFSKTIANFKYYIQASFYLELTNAKEFYFVVLETNNPFMVGIYKLDRQSLEFGMSEVRRAFEIYKNLDKFKDSVFLDFENEYKAVQELTLPNYVYYQKGASF